MRVQFWQIPRRRWRAALLVMAVALTGVAVVAEPAQALPMNVKVTVERIHADDCFEPILFGCGGKPDFYAVVRIDGKEFSKEGEDVEDDSDIQPDWQFTHVVDHSKRSVGVQFEIRDEDGGLRLSDDLADVSPTVGDKSFLDVNVNLSPCAISGEVSGSCDTTIKAEGNGDGDGDAELYFRIDVTQPTSAPGLRVNCLHDSIWPQPGETVTIHAFAQDGAHNSFVANTIEIWFNNRVAPAMTVSGDDDLQFTSPVLQAGTFTYGCRVIDNNVPVFTQWRTVQVGQPPTGRAAPILFTGPRSSRIDIVFLADVNDYPPPLGPLNPQLRTDLRPVMEAYLGADRDDDVYMRNMDKFNFYVALDGGDAVNNCMSTLPANWYDDYGWADAGGIAHRQPDGVLRDCAPGGGRYFSAGVTKLRWGKLGRVFLHETGHRPFGLSDEYTTARNFFQADPFPNVYETKGACESDAGNLGRTAADCRTWNLGTEDWYSSEPASDDLMVDDGVPRAADIRRFEWLFGRCTAAEC